MNTILVTGSAGFIGSSLVLKLLKRGDLVVGLDNHNDYYDPSLKEARLSNLIQNKNYTHIRADLQDKETIEEVFNKYMPDHVVNLAAQAGVRYSIENPGAYIGSNIVGFNNILECCRHHSIKHLVYASSSSVYGANETIPFSVRDNVDHPISLYAATKKSNELTAHAYSNLFNLPTTGLRFFTVYGPWGRPDMALFKFTKAILENKKIQVYNYGNHRRDFTYIDDIVEGVMRVLDSPAASNKNWSGLNPDPGSSKAPWKVYNIGNNNPVNLLDFIKVIERFLGKEVQKELLPMQPGDVADTYADVQNLVDEFNFQPSTSIEEGIEKFITWYKDFYRV
ncbi:NAD-dependent epimerase [Gammaproteobacteria bacterium]|nr:NAD-dependent epimerase [Gammaproteobacteria bacterium]